MIGSIERNWRWIARRELVPMLGLALALNPDPTHKATGYGGVLPLPAPASTPAPNCPKPDATVDQRRDTHTARGRVLYSDGRTLHNASVDASHTAHTVPARPGQRVGQQPHAVATAPTS